MKRYLDDLLGTDLQRKMILLTGPRQVGKTTLCRQQMAAYDLAQYLNWDIAADRAILQRASWNPRSGLLVMDEIHKMPSWKNWLKGVADGRPPTQALLVTGSRDMMTPPKANAALAGRINGIRVAALDGGHSMMQEAPGATLDALKGFLKP